MANLIRWWKGNGNAKDSSNLLNDGTWTGTELYSTGKRFNQCFQFDGVSHVTFNNTHPVSGTNTFTLSCWLSIANIAGSGYIYDDNRDVLLIQRSASGGDFLAYINTTTGTYTIQLDSSLFTINTLIHITLVYDGVTFRGYYNGLNDWNVTNNVAATGTILSTARSFVLGERDTVFDSYWTGTIGDIRLYSDVLTNKEILNLYKTGPFIEKTGNLNSWEMNEVGKSDNIMCYYKGNGDLRDSVSKFTDASLIGSATTTGVGNRFPYCFNLPDGSTSYIVLPSTDLFNQTSWTLSMMVNITAFNGTFNYIWWVNDDEPGARFSATGTSIFFSIDGNAGQRLDVTTDPNDFIGKWVHLMFVCDYNNSLKLYKNGVDMGGVLTGAVTNNATGIRAFRLGSDGVVDRALYGRVEEFRVFTTALNAQERDLVYKTSSGKISTLKTNKIGALEFDEMGSGISNLKLWVKGDGNVYDDSGNSNNGTLGSTTVFGTGNKFDSALQFDGTTNSIVTINDSVTLSPIAEISITFWMKFTATGVNSGLFRKAPHNYEPYRVYLTTTQTVGIQISQDGATRDFLDSTTVLTLNTWYHISAVWKPGTNEYKLFINGNLDIQKTTTLTSIIDNSNIVEIGGNSGRGQYFNGFMEDIKLFDRALTANEIKTLYGSSAASFNKTGVIDVASEIKEF